MTTPTTTAAAQAYLGAVDRELSDLPLDVRTDLVEDLALHLVALDEEGDDRPYELRLGTPVAYAAELRGAAGLPPRGAVGAQPAPAPPFRQLRSDLQRECDRLASTRAGREVLSFLPLLEPGWWVLRAFLLVVALGLFSDFGLLNVGGLAVLAVAVVGSVALGRRSLRPDRRRLLLVAEVALVVWALLVLTTAGRGVEYVYVDDPAPATASSSYPLLSTAGPVTDIFPYTSAGVPLEDVLLFDQDGRPLRVGEQEWWADDCRRTALAPRAADGVPVPFAYPQNYVLDGQTLYGDPPQPGQCQELTRPQVPLPVFTAATPGLPTPTPSASPEPSEGPTPTASLPPAATPGPSPGAVVPS